MNPPLTIYLDTSVISAYFDDRTPDRRDETRRFWDFAKDCQMFASRLVLRELGMTPDPVRKNDLLELVRGLPLLSPTPAVNLLAADFIAENLVPAKKLDDAQHLALAVVHRVDYLVSWNFKHMVNFRTIRKLPMLSAKNGHFKPLAVISPESFTTPGTGGNP